MTRTRLFLASLTTLFATSLMLVVPSPAGAVVAGANGRIAFVSDRDGDKEIYVMRSDGTAVTQLTTNTFSDYDPSVSGDGLKIAFISDRDGAPELYVMNIDGTSPTRLTTNLGAVVESHPSWAPNGSAIGYAGLSGTDSEIYTIKPDGTHVLNLTNDATAYDDHPSWSPGGIKIAFDSTNRGGDPTTQVYTMNNDGTLLTKLTSAGNNSNPSWAPDNKNLTFQSTRDAPQPGASHFADVFQPVGLAFSPTALLVTQLTKDQVLSVDPSGVSTTFATLPTTGGANLERYIAVSPGLGGFQSGYVYVTVRQDILQITPDGQTVTTFTTIPNLPASNNTIAFDTVGTFGNDMLIAAGKKALLYRVHSDGTFILVRDMHSVAQELEAPEVAPLDYTPYGGQVVVSDKLDNKIWAINPTGGFTEVGTWPSGDEVDFVPPTACNYGTSAGAYFLAMRDSNEIKKFGAADFTGVTGALVAGETTTDIGLFHSNGTSIEISQFSPPIGTPELEGTDFAPCGSGKPVQQPSVTDTREIYKMTSTGLSQTRLTTNTFDDINPAYSPDGLTIVFQSDRDDPGQPACEGAGTCKYEIYKMNSSGGTGQTNISNNITANDTSPDWQAVSRVVTVNDFFFDPATAKPTLGGTVLWDFVGASDHTATDNSGMLLFDSGTKSTGGSFAFRFIGAGSYPIICTIHPLTMLGTVKVPMKAVPKTGNTTTVFTITWAAAPPPSGFRYDVQISRPGGPGFVDWKPNTTLKSATFTADAGTGTYLFQARIRKLIDGTASNYSAPVSITVNP